MTTVRPAHKAQGTRLTELATTNTRTIKIGSKNRYDEKYSLSVAEMREGSDEVVPAASPRGHKSLPVASLISFSAEALAIGDDRRPLANCTTALSGLQHR